MAREGNLVSVIIAAFNSESYLGEAIASVLDQDRDPLEVIVADDGSTDNTGAIARGFGPRLRVVHGADEGLAATRNRGTAAADGRFLLHMDADDLLAPNAIRALMDVFEQDASCDISAGMFSCFVSPELSSDVASRFPTPAGPQRGHLSGVALVRAEVFERVGPLNDSYRPASDMEWWLRARDHGLRVTLIDDVVGYRRIHGRNSSLRESASLRQAALRITREALRRKRSGIA